MSARTLVILAAAAVLAGCERPPMEAEQLGYRGTGMEHIINPRIADDRARDARHAVPEPLPAVPAAGPKASEVYQNVQVLGDLSVAQFTRLMTAITAWVAPQQGCNYCHEGQNFAEDKLYTKLVARSMIRMTQDVNANYQAHVKETGVTCYTCHRGQNIPRYGWHNDPGLNRVRGFRGTDSGQNLASASVGYTSLPYEPFTGYLQENESKRVIGNTALPTGENPADVKDAEYTYALMMHFSRSLGVNCTYCHNSRAFGDWAQSPPTRVLAWHGAQMTRHINNEYIIPLTPQFPPHRLGLKGDVVKTNCSTCHQGVNKPLYGAGMLSDYPALAAPSGQ